MERREHRGQQCFHVCLFFSTCFTVSNVNLHNKSLIHTEGFNERKPLICLPRLETFPAVQALLSKHLAADSDDETIEINGATLLATTAAARTHNVRLIRG